jgi:hypothetical protein
MKKIQIPLALAAAVTIGISGCTSDADVASENLSKAADNFEIMRRIVFYNGITGEYLLEVIGLCSLGNYDDPGQLTVTCKTENDRFKKHFLGLSDNVTYFAEQIEGVDVSTTYYRVTFKPQTIVPDVDIRTEANLPQNQD